MLRNSLILCVLLNLSYCFGQTGNTSSSATAQLQKQKACEVLSIEQVADLLNVDVANLVKEDMSFAEGKRRSICHIVVKDEIASYNMRLGWKSERAQAKKVLEKNYAKYLSQGEEQMKNYQELKNDGDVQILYGVEKGKQGTNHLIRKRYGNSAEVKIEILTSTENQELKNLLLEIVEKI